jgi:iron(III) transport system permease protein
VQAAGVAGRHPHGAGAAVRPARPWARRAIVAVAGATIALPLAIIVYQSLLDAPFFQPTARFSLEAWRFVFADGDFHRALRCTVLLAAGMAAIAVSCGAVLAFLVVRTDLPGRGWLEPAVLVPIFLSPVVLAFGYVVAVGPVGFFTLWIKQIFGGAPWNLYSLASVTAIAGLTHIPHVYLYVSATLRSLGADLEEAALVAGANPARVAATISLPMVWPAILSSGVLVFFLGFELFGLPLILGDPEGILVLSTYLYKLTNRLGVPSYQLMAVVAVVIMAIAFPLVWLQRRLLGAAGRYVSVRGKGLRQRPLPLGPWRWVAFAGVLLWLVATVLLPLSGTVLRSVVTTWGEGVRLGEVLTLDHFRELLEYPNLVRGIFNTIAIGVLGGALSVACYAAVALASHRWQSRWAKAVDYLVMVPRGMPGLVAGLAFFWLFLFIKPLAPLRSTVFSVWLAYTVVWFAYGMRLISSALLQVGPELEEAGLTVGASPRQVVCSITLPLVRFGLLGSWLLIFLIFVREYSTAVYLLGPGTEVIGSLIVSLWATGAIDTVAALAVVNVVLVGLGLAVALRLGVRLHE